MALSPGDSSSFSLPEQCRVTNIDIILTVNFAKHILSGIVGLDVEKSSSDVVSLILDTRDLKIHKVTYQDQELAFSVGDPVASFGSKLEVTLPKSDDKVLSGIRVEYETSPNSTALQWLTPEQTLGKQHPYMFSQCQAIHARSMLPCQDTPSVKAPYTATLTVPANLVALMSAVKLPSEEACSSEESCEATSQHRFKQAVPIPSYLIAIVVGRLEGRKIGPRSTVWSEKDMVDASAYEFAETEEMLATAEKLMGPYVWGVYDLLVLPPSFPYGGMENPCLTFVTPTLLAGDRSLATVVAHEIAHSWTGNLITNSNWEHFWLNEGHTVFVERKIISRMKGEKFRQFEANGGLNEGHTVFVERKIFGRLKNEQFRHFACMDGWRNLKNTVEDVFGSEHAYTKLVPALNGVDPDDAFSTVPYEKGSALLMYLEQKLGGPDVFEPFLKAYVEKFSKTSITTTQWKDFIYEFFNTKKNILEEVEWDKWFFDVGMPPVKPVYDVSLAEACTALAQKWVAAGDHELLTLSLDTAPEVAQSSLLLREFLAQLLEEKPLSADKIQRLAEVFKFNNVKNSEIRFRWLRLCLRARVKGAIPLAVTFVNEQGRMKFTRPLYRDLYQWDASKDQAVANFQENRAYMHSITATMVAKDLKLTQ